MRRLTLLLPVLLLIAAAPAPEVFGFDEDLVIRGATPGIVLGSTVTPPALVGRVCLVEFATANNRSTHDTDVEVRSGGDGFVLADVETGDGQAVSEGAPLLLGETVEVVLAATSGTTSLSFAVTVTCDPLPEPDPDPEPEPEPEPDPDPLPDPDPEPTPLPEIGPDPERDCADGPDPDSDEFADADAWAEWYAANCDLPADDPDPDPATPDEPVEPTPATSPPPPSLPDTGVPALLLLFAGLVAVGTGTAVLRR